MTNKEKATDARYAAVNGNYYSKAKIAYYEAHSLTDEQIALFKAEEEKLRSALNANHCSLPSLAAWKEMCKLFPDFPHNRGCGHCVVTLAREAAELYFYTLDKAMEEANAKTFVEETLKAEAPAPAKKPAAPKKKAASKKK